MINQVIDINNRLKLICSDASPDLVFLAADVFCLSRAMERELTALVWDGGTIVQGLIKVAGVTDDIGIDWDTEAGAWVQVAMTKMAGEIEVMGAHLTAKRIMRRYLGWFDDKGLLLLEDEEAA